MGLKVDSECLSFPLCGITATVSSDLGNYEEKRIVVGVIPYVALLGASLLGILDLAPQAVVDLS
jgi:hypothetical protein